MESQKRQLEAAILENGWRVAKREAITTEWWADEIWTIESVWRPVGFKVFLTFLVDPAYSGLGRPGEGVLAISCSSIRPESRADAAAGPTIYLRPSWEKNLPEFLSNIKEIRDNALITKGTRVKPQKAQKAIND